MSYVVFCFFVLFLFMIFFGFAQSYGFGSIDLKGMQADNLCNVVPPTSRSTNSIALRFSDSSSGIPVRFYSSVSSSKSFTVIFTFGV